VLYPFEQAPPSVEGQEYTLHFWVDRRGAVTKVEVEPKIEDAAFRKALLDRLRQWVFYPARTEEGRPVRGEFMVPYTP
jgi:TonB family protein